MATKTQVSVADQQKEQQQQHIIGELLQFVDKDARADLRLNAIDYLFAVTVSTGTKSQSVCDALYAGEHSSTAVHRILDVHLNCENTRPQTTAILIQISANFPKHRHTLITHDNGALLEQILNTHWSDIATSKLLSNLTLITDDCLLILNKIGDDAKQQDFVLGILHLLNTTPITQTKSVSDYAGNVLRNCSQIPYVRKWLCDATSPQHPLDTLLALCTSMTTTTPEHMTIASHRCKVVLDVMRNLCMDTDLHPHLISNEQFIVTLLMPLCGGETLRDDEYDLLPLDLQYLSEDKCRHRDFQIRQTLCEALYQLCATRVSRVKLRDLGVYALLREYHKWEPNDQCQLLCGNVISLLIRTEDDLEGVDDIRKLDVRIDESVEPVIHSNLTQMNPKGGWL